MQKELQLDKNAIIDHLSHDLVFKPLLEKIEFPVFVTPQSRYLRLVDIIISQQLSSKAADTIYARFEQLFRGMSVTPEVVEKISDEALRACGISWSKIKYIKGLTADVLEKRINLDTLDDFPNELVIDELTKLKGIGRWSAEMFLIFVLHRMDIFSVADLGLRAGVAKLYNVDATDYEKIEEISRAWSPYRSVACRYLWKSLDITV